MDPLKIITKTLESELSPSYKYKWISITQRLSQRKIQPVTVIMIKKT